MSKKSDGLPGGLESAGLKKDPTSKGQEKDPKDGLTSTSLTPKRQRKVVCRIAYVNNVVDNTYGVVLRFPVVRGRGKRIEKRANYGCIVHLLGEDNKDFVLVNAPSLDSILLEEDFGNNEIRSVSYDKVKELNPLCDLPECVHLIEGNDKYNIVKVLSNDEIVLADKEGETVSVAWHQIVECRLRR